MSRCLIDSRLRLPFGSGAILFTTKFNIQGVQYIPGPPGEMSPKLCLRRYGSIQSLKVRGSQGPRPGEMNVRIGLLPRSPTLLGLASTRQKIVLANTIFNKSLKYM